MRSFRNTLRKQLDSDAAISPVIGTILMIAATVIIGGAVYAAVNAYSGKASKNNVDAAFRAQAIDADGDGRTDTVKVTYLSGPTGATASVTATGNATALAPGATAGATWDPGEFATWTTNGDVSDTAFVSAAIGDQTFLDQTLRLDE